MDDFNRKLTMDNPAAPAPAPGDANRDAGLAQVAAQNRQALAGRQNRYAGASDMRTAPTGAPGPVVAAPMAAKVAAPMPSGPININPEANMQPRALNPEGVNPGADALSRLRASRPAAPMAAGPVMRPAMQPTAPTPYADLRLNPRSFANSQIAAAPRAPAPGNPVVAPRTAPLVPPAVQQQITPFDAGGYLQNNPDIADSFAQYQNGTINEAARGWYDNIPEAAKVSPEAFAQWHYNNIGKNEPGRNPGGRPPGTLTGA